jgi:hypothetical protein
MLVPLENILKKRLSRGESRCRESYQEAYRYRDHASCERIYATAQHEEDYESY